MLSCNQQLTLAFQAALQHARLQASVIDDQGTALDTDVWIAVAATRATARADARRYTTPVELIST